MNAAQHRHRLAPITPETESIAGLTSDQLIAPRVIEGAMNQTAFETYVETPLAPLLNPGSTISEPVRGACAQVPIAMTAAASARERMAPPNELNSAQTRQLLNSMGSTMKRPRPRRMA